MIDWIDHMLRLIDAELGQPTAVRALLAGFVVSWGLTQLLKYLPHLRAYSDRQFRWAVRVLAFLLGALPTFLLWPEHDLQTGALMALVVGVLAPTVYTVVVRAAVHWWPWLDDKVSARPAP